MSATLWLDKNLKEPFSSQLLAKKLSTDGKTWMREIQVVF